MGRRLSRLGDAHRVGRAARPRVADAGRDQEQPYAGRSQRSVLRAHASIRDSVGTPKADLKVRLYEVPRLPTSETLWELEVGSWKLGVGRLRQRVGNQRRPGDDGDVLLAASSLITHRIRV